MMIRGETRNVRLEGSEKTYSEVRDDPEEFEDECWDEDTDEEGDGAFDGLARGGRPADAAEATANDRGLVGNTTMSGCQ